MTLLRAGRLMMTVKCKEPPPHCPYRRNIRIAQEANRLLWLLPSTGLAGCLSWRYFSNLDLIWEGVPMSEQIQWNIYSEMEAEVTALWDLVQETLASFNLSEPKTEETEAA